MPARVDGAARPTRGWRAGPARRRRTSTGSSAARPSIRRRRPVDGDREQAVVAARAQPRDRAHRVAAERRRPPATRARGLVERAAARRARARSSGSASPSRAVISSPSVGLRPAPADQVGDEARPAGLVRGAEAGAVVAVEVLVEQRCCPSRPGRLQPLDPAEARAPAVRRRRGRARSSRARRSSAISPSVSCWPRAGRVLDFTSSPKERA